MFLVAELLLIEKKVAYMLDVPLQATFSKTLVILHSFDNLQSSLLDGMQSHTYMTKHAPLV